MISEKTFRIGGVAGYSVRAVGSMNRSGPVYSHIELWDDEAAKRLTSWPLDGVKPVPTLILMDLDAESRKHLEACFDEVWKRRAL